MRWRWPTTRTSCWISRAVPVPAPVVGLVYAKVSLKVMVPSLLVMEPVSVPPVSAKTSGAGHDAADRALACGRQGAVHCAEGTVARHESTVGWVLSTPRPEE